jgi:transposase
MTVATDDFSAWLTQARVLEHRLTPDQRGVLFAAFHFRQSRGDDSYSTRLLSHFLLHAQTGLKVAQIARLVGVSRPTASGQQGMSSKQAVQQAHHRLDGRPYGKLLPRFAGPIIEFLLARPQATRADLIDFIDQTFGVRVSRIALYKFLKKFGLDRVGVSAPGTAPAVAAASPDPSTTRPVATPTAASAPPFCSDVRASRARS